MKKIILVYPPFCTPASPPYSLTAMHAFLKENMDGKNEMDVFDMNLEFHKIKFNSYREYCKNLDKDYDADEYSSKTLEYKKETTECYSLNNKKVVNDEDPELLSEMYEKLMKKITGQKKESGLSGTCENYVAFSIVYSSQVFYALAMIRKLKGENPDVKTIVGGPAVNEKLKGLADMHLANEIEMLGAVEERKIDHDALSFDYYPDFSIWNLEGYFVPENVIPLKTCNGCYYRQCTFCTHHQGREYFEIDISDIEKTVAKSPSKIFFLIDDMIHKKRLLEIAAVMKKYNATWTCQLKPTLELDKETLKTLYDSGLKIIMWGMESANQRILDKIKKGTNVKDIEKVLNDAHSVGIKNIVYIIFGFPSETKEEAIETVDFLEKNKDAVDLVSTSIFGLQPGTAIFNNPAEFGITSITEHNRTVLDSNYTYTVSSGMSQEDAQKFRKGYKKTLESFNKFPKIMNFFREHMVCLTK